MLAVRTHQRTRHLRKHYNLEFLKDYYGTDVSSMQIILKLYLQETPKDIATIGEHLNNNNAASAKEATHKMKANVAMLGITDPAEFITAMHFLAATDDVNQEILLKFNAFRTEVLAAMQEIKADYFS